MSQEIARQLLSAGGTADAEGNTSYLLVVDPKSSSLNCQHWNGATLAKQEVLVESVRPNSTAAYIISANEKIVIFIAPNSKLSAYTFDEDEREWVESDADDIPITHYSVHPNGKITSSPDASGRVSVFFQNASGRLVCLDDAWASTTLPGSPIAGTPIVVLATLEGDLVVHYISSTDNFIHAVARGEDGNWNDLVAFKYAFTEGVKALCLGDGEVYVLTAANAVFKVSLEGKKTDLGTVKDGKYAPKTVEEAQIRETYYPNGRLKSRTIHGNYIQGYDANMYYRRW